MLITNLTLKNWRNFTHVDVALQKRQFIVGANASGKSNLLDAFRFLHDIAKPQGGGLRQAVGKRGGMSKLRCLSARKDTEVKIGVSLSEAEGDSRPKWRYEIGIMQESRRQHAPYVSCERVLDAGGKTILERPGKDDEADTARLSQTYLEQVNNNFDFREIQKYFEKISYMHLVPQLLRHADEMQSSMVEDDPFGQGLLQNMAKSAKRTRDSRLRVISKIIKATVPRMDELDFMFDPANGRPHITARYSHWRGQAARQAEDQFSDGTLRLVGLVWSLLEGNSMLLLEEPELSLHAEIVRRLASFLYRAQRKNNQQVLISTHSADLLTDEIGGEEVLLLTPTNEGTQVEISSDLADVKALLMTGIATGEVVIPRTRPENVENVSLLDLS